MAMLLFVLTTTVVVDATCVSSGCTNPLLDCFSCQNSTPPIWSTEVNTIPYFCNTFTGGCAINTTALLQINVNDCNSNSKDCCVPEFYTAWTLSNFFAADADVLGARRQCGLKSCAALQLLTVVIAGNQTLTDTVSLCSNSALYAALGALALVYPSPPLPPTFVDLPCKITFHDAWTVTTNDDVNVTPKLITVLQAMDTLGYVTAYTIEPDGVGCSPLGVCMRNASAPTTFTGCCVTADDCVEAGFPTPDPCTAPVCDTPTGTCGNVSIPYCCHGNNSECSTLFDNVPVNPLQIVCGPNPDPTQNYLRCLGVYTNDDGTMCSDQRPCAGLQLCSNATCDPSLHKCVVVPRAFPATQLCCTDSTEAGLAECQVRSCEKVIGCRDQPYAVGTPPVMALPDFTCRYETFFETGCCASDADCHALALDAPCILSQTTTNPSQQINGICPAPGGQCLLADVNPDANPLVHNLPCCYNDDQCGEEPPRAPLGDPCSYFACTGAPVSPAFPAFDSFTCLLVTPAQPCSGAPTCVLPVPTVLLGFLSTINCTWNCAGPPDPVTNPINVLTIVVPLHNQGPWPVYAFDVLVTVSTIPASSLSIDMLEMTVDNATTLLETGRAPLASTLFEPSVPVVANDTHLFSQRFNMSASEPRKFMPNETWGMTVSIAFVGDGAISAFLINMTLLPYDVCSDFYAACALPTCATAADVFNRTRIYHAPTSQVYAEALSGPICSAACVNDTGSIPLPPVARDDDDVVDGYYENSQSATDSDFSHGAGVVYYVYPTSAPTPLPTPGSLAPTPAPPGAPGSGASVPGVTPPPPIRISGQYVYESSSSVSSNGDSALGERISQQEDLLRQEEDQASEQAEQLEETSEVNRRRRRRRRRSVAPQQRKRQTPTPAPTISIVTSPAVSANHVGGVVFFDGNADGENLGSPSNDANLGGIRVFAVDANSGLILASTTTASLTGLFQFARVPLFNVVSDQSLGAFFRIEAPPFGMNVTILGTLSNVYVDNAFSQETLFYVLQPAPATSVVSPTFVNSTAYVQLNAGFKAYVAPVCVPVLEFPVAPVLLSASAPAPAPAPAHVDDGPYEDANSEQEDEQEDLMRVLDDQKSEAADGANEADELASDARRRRRKRAALVFAENDVVLAVADNVCENCVITSTDIGGCAANVCGSSSVQERVEVEFTISNFNTTLVNATLVKPGGVLIVEFHQQTGNAALASALCVAATNATPSEPSPNTITAVDSGRAILTGPDARPAYVTYTWPQLPPGSDVLRFRVRFDFCATSQLFAYNVTAHIRSNLCVDLYNAWLNCTTPTPNFVRCAAAIRATADARTCDVCPPTTPAPPAGGADERSSSSSASSASSASSVAEVDTSYLSDFSDLGGADAGADDTDEQSSSGPGSRHAMQNGNSSSTNTSLVLFSEFVRDAATCINATLIKRLYCDDRDEALATCATSPDAGMLKAIVFLSASARAESGVLHVSLTRHMSSSPASGTEFCRSFDPTVGLEVLQGSTIMAGRARVVDSHVDSRRQSATLAVEFAGFNNETLLVVVLGVLECPPAAGLLNYTLVARLATSRCFDAVACTRTLALLPPTEPPVIDGFCTPTDTRFVFASRHGPGVHAVDAFAAGDAHRHDNKHVEHHSTSGWIILGLLLVCTALCFFGVVGYTFYYWMWVAPAAVLQSVHRSTATKRK